MVDEFQDASQARKPTVVRGCWKPGRYLLAVGDDWQSINRFAGADISVMTDFEDVVRRGPTLRLKRRSGCPQSICDTGQHLRRPRIPYSSKTVRSVQPEYGPPVRIVRTVAGGTAKALEDYLDALSAAAVAVNIEPGPNGDVSVRVLGRYGFDRDVMPGRRRPAWTSSSSRLTAPKG